MLYTWLTWCSRRALQWCYREVRVVGAVPTHGPVLLAVNHPNDLPDICLVLTSTPRRVAFVANVTAAEQPLVKWAYAKMGVVPVHRVRDARKARARGEDSAQANAQAFATVRALLADGQCVCVFPEGGVHRGPELGRMRAGLARMALDARDQGGVGNLRIVPVGITYEAPNELRSRVLVEIGEPVKLDGWTANPARPADVQLTEMVARRLRRLTRNAPSEATAQVLRAVADLAAASTPTDSSDTPPILAGTEVWQSLAADLCGEGVSAGALHDERLTPARSLTAWLDSLSAHASRSRLLTAWHAMAPDASRTAALSDAVRAPLAALGLTLHAPAWRLLNRLATRTARDPADIMALRIIPGLYVMTAWYLTLFALLWYALGWPTALVLTACLPALGTLSQRWRDRAGDRRLRALVLREDPTFGTRLQQATDVAKQSPMPAHPSPQRPSSV